MKISQELKAKVRLLKDRGDLDIEGRALGILDPVFTMKIKKAKERKVICVGVTETRQELIENKIKDKWRTYEI